MKKKRKLFLFTLLLLIGMCFGIYENKSKVNKLLDSDALINEVVAISQTECKSKKFERSGSGFQSKNYSSYFKCYSTTIISTSNISYCYDPNDKGSEYQSGTFVTTYRVYPVKYVSCADPVTTTTKATTKTTTTTKATTKTTTTTKATTKTTTTSAAKYCTIKTQSPNGEVWTIKDGNYVDSGYYGINYSCKTSSCSVTYSGLQSNFKGLAGDGNCSTGVRTTGTTLYCSSGTLIATPCYSSTTTTSSSSGNTSERVVSVKIASSGGGTFTIKHVSGDGYISAEGPYFKEICNSGDCRFQLNAKSDSGYTFDKWSSDSSCKNVLWEYADYPAAILKDDKSRTIYACFKTNNNSGGSSTTNAIPSKLSVTIIDTSNHEAVDGIGNVSVYDAVTNGNFIRSVTKHDIFTCEKDSCSYKLSANSVSSNYIFKGFYSDIKCTNSIGSNPLKLILQAKENYVYACYTKNSTSGGGNPHGGNNVTASPEPITSDKTITIPKPPVTEPAIPDKVSVKINAYVWATDDEYSGDRISCGDKIYVTGCTDEVNSICNVTSINGKNVSTTTQIYKKNFVANESDTGCYEVSRYVSENTYSYSDSNLKNDKKELACGTSVKFTKSIDIACTNLSCEVSLDGKTIYVSKDNLMVDKPVCNQNNSSSSCTSSNSVTNLKDSITIKLCKNDDTEENRNSIVSCASDYDKKYNLINDTCKSDTSDNCFKEYKYTCDYIKRPSVAVSAGTIGYNGLGTISLTARDNGNVGINGYYMSSGDAPTQNSNWTKFSDSSYNAYESRSAGTYFVWVLNNKNRISYPVMAKVYDGDLSTTLKSFGANDANGNSLSMTSLDTSTIGYEDIVVDSNYALLSNKLLKDSDLALFDSLTTAYEINVSSNKVALYATLTSTDASYVNGYEPRTIDLEYGRNVALIKIVNNKGKERTYTFIINRVDDRDGSNLLSDITLSKGKIEFDSYVPSYDVSVPKNTTKVSINGTLVSDKANFVKGYEPRVVELTEDIQSAVLRVRSESGSVRSYVITFIKNGTKDDDLVNSTYLSSLTVPGTQLGFDKNVYDYTISVPYDVEDIPIYAFAESANAIVSVGNNTGLRVGNNLIEINVKNGNKTKIYSLHVIRKESGLDISNSNRLSLLSIKNYDINFNPDILDYSVSIKREKTLLITASPESNRAEVYMYGNNDLTGFSTIRVKVIAENGGTNIYSIDIQKAAYNKTVEYVVVISGGLFVLTSAIILLIRNKKKKMKEYLEG